MDLLVNTVMPLAAAGYSLMYMLLGGGAVGRDCDFYHCETAGQVELTEPRTLYCKSPTAPV